MKKSVVFGLVSCLLATGLYAEGVEFHKNADNKNDANYVKFIPKNKAVKIAYEQAGVEADDVSICRAKIDRKKTGPVYEIEFIVGDTEYEIDIDAVSGSVVGMEADFAQIPNELNKGFIGVAKAKTIALNYAGIKPEASVNFMKVELDRDDGLIVYELDFTCNGRKYEYEIDAVTGKLLKAE